MKLLFPQNELAQIIDHTLLKPEATSSQIESLCSEAIQIKMGAVCINPYWVPFCRQMLSDKTVKICTVIGFPLGSNTTAIKNIELRNAIENGAEEIDMVMNIGLFKSGEFEKVEDEIRQIVFASDGVLVKVILETCLLTDAEKIIACKLAQSAGAQYVKTSTGFNRHGATIEDVALMRKTVGSTMGVKAAGGIRDLATAMAMIDAGASRLGTSSGVNILSAFEKSRESND